MVGINDLISGSPIYVPYECYTPEKGYYFAPVQLTSYEFLVKIDATEVRMDGPHVDIFVCYVKESECRHNQWGMMNIFDRQEECKLVCDERNKKREGLKW